MAKITINKGYPGTQKLDLSDRGFTQADKRETIVWEIGKDSGVQLISNIRAKKSAPTNVIFSEMPHRVSSSDNWKATIDKDSPDYSEFHYDIYWIPDPGTDPIPAIPIKTYDPIIAVKPSPILTPYFILMLLGLVGLIALKLYLNKKSIKHHRI